MMMKDEVEPKGTNNEETKLHSIQRLQYQQLQ